jgi:acyl carrier protein
MDQRVALHDAELLDLLKRALLFARPERADVAARLTLSSTMDELGIESVVALEMVGFLEEELNIQFQDSELSQIQSMDSLARLIKKHTSR